MTDNPCHNPWEPYLGKITQVADLADQIKLFRVQLMNGGGRAFADYHPGQFAFLSAFGVGEAPFGIASTPERGAHLDFAVNRLGNVTSALHVLGEGDMVGVRGPMGNWFPMEEFIGKNLIVIGGGIGGAPLRPVIQHVLDHRNEYGHLTILWAARHPSLLVFVDEYDEWIQAPGTELQLTVDTPDQKWDRNVGLVTQLLERVAPSPANAVTITCGPPVMIYYVGKLLEQMGFTASQNYVTLEARMHCGLGKCGRCNLGEKLVCVDGPVFTMEEVDGLLEDFKG
jgi:NAD(P)H-flavin reductase